MINDLHRKLGLTSGLLEEYERQRAWYEEVTKGLGRAYHFDLIDPFAAAMNSITEAQSLAQSGFLETIGESAKRILDATTNPELGKSLAQLQSGLIGASRNDHLELVRAAEAWRAEFAQIDRLSDSYRHILESVRSSQAALGLQLPAAQTEARRIAEINRTLLDPAGWS